MKSTTRLLCVCLCRYNCRAPLCRYLFDFSFFSSPILCCLLPLVSPRFLLPPPCFFFSFLSFEWKWAAILVGKSACDDYIFRQTMQFQIFCKLSLSFIIIQPFRADGCRHNCRQECVSSKGSISLSLSPGLQCSHLVRF